MNKRFLLFYFALVTFGIILAGRLFQLTIVNGSANRELADNQRLRLRKITALRGIIYDRNRKPLVGNVPIFKRCPYNQDKCYAIGRPEALKMEA